MTTLEGDTLSLDALRGQLVVLEFYAPEDETFLRELPGRSALHRLAGGEELALVSVSVQPDTVVNAALFEDRDVPGRHVIAPEGLDSQIVRRYNVTAVPRRFLIDREGRIVGAHESDQGRVVVALDAHVGDRTRTRGAGLHRPRGGTGGHLFPAIAWRGSTRGPV